MNLLIAARGTSSGAGLVVASGAPAGDWQTRLLDRVDDLAALALHPTAPVVYGLSGLGRGRLIAWDIEGVTGGGGVRRIADLDCRGDIPCDLSTDPEGRVLVAANFGVEAEPGGTLTTWELNPEGSPIGEGKRIELEGSSIDPDRQSVPHPHQIVFDGGRLYVPDLGADLIRRFDLARDGGLEHLVPIPTPPGTGPRHLVVTPVDAGAPRLVTSGELSGAIAVGRADPAHPGWRTSPGSQRTGPAATRSPRNYPGDLKLSRDGRVALFANRGYDTIASFSVADDAHRDPDLISEIDAGAAWPQHMLVVGGDLLVAGWDDSSVMRIPLERTGELGDASVAFSCVEPGWLLPIV